VRHDRGSGGEQIYFSWLFSRLPICLVTKTRRVAAVQHEIPAVKRVDIAAGRVTKLSFTLLRLTVVKAQ
jgi:hypothetical protein